MGRKTSPGNLAVRDYIQSVKATGCVICNEEDTDVLDFHHVVPEDRSFTISSSWKHKGMDKVAEEVAKCVILCANCHRRVHAGTATIPREKLPWNL